jgi:hypothetical protein
MTLIDRNSHSVMSYALSKNNIYMNNILTTLDKKKLRKKLMICMRQSM